MMIYLIIISVSAVVSVARGSCDMALQKAMACSSNLEGIFAGSSPSKSNGHGDIDKLVQACRNGDLLTAIGCFEIAMGECKDNQSDASIILRKIIDTKKARTSIDLICTNIVSVAHDSNLECKEHDQKDQVVCAQDAKTTFLKQISTDENVDALLLLYCAYYQALMECVQRVLVKCSEEAVSIMKTVMEGFEPPICSERTTSSNDYSGDVARSSCCKSSAHNILIILLSTFILVLCRSAWLNG